MQIDFGIDSNNTDVEMDVLDESTSIPIIDESPILETDFNIDSEIVDVDMSLIDDSSGIEIDFEEDMPGGTKDYNKLYNKPSINNTELIGNYDEIDPTVPKWAKEDEPPQPETMTEVDVEFLWKSIFKGEE